MKDNLNKIWHKHDGKGMPIFLQNEQFEVQLADGSLKKNHKQGWDWYKKSCDNVIPLERDSVISWRYIVAEDYAKQASEGPITEHEFKEVMEIAMTVPEARYQSYPEDNRLTKYQRLIRGKDIDGHVASIVVDVYDVLTAWETTNPALQHLIKKALRPGERGHKSLVEDLKDIIASAQRALEIEQSKEVLK
ncbi:hypothetical protein ODDIEODDIE_39 [Escherichia phage vB_EcoS_OddieOddie]|nr:hypothetical protein ODDIEODDIE_39 [Escherichia phage vB_EcoS_OddieOddie]